MRVLVMQMLRAAPFLQKSEDNSMRAELPLINMGGPAGESHAYE